MSTAEDPRPLYLRKLFPRSQGKPDRLSVVAVPPGEAPAYARAALADEVATLTATGEGGRNHQLNRSGFNLAQLVAAGHLDHDTAWNALHAAGLSTGLPEREVVGTLRSAFRAGMEKPRLVALDTATDVPEVTTMPVPEQLSDDPDAPPSLAERFKAIDWHELWADNTTDEWIVYPLLPARRLVALFSPPKVGKSLLMLELAVAIARGLPVLGTTLDRPRTVLYVDFENDPRGDVRPRLEAMGLSPGDLDNLKYLTMPRLAYLDTNVGGLELLAIAKLYGAEVVVIDTISRAVNGEENDNDTWLAFYRHTGIALKSEGIATIRLDHTGKDPAKGMRGGSAKYGDVDAVWSLTKVDETTLRLECTANRLPIAEKLLHLDRVSDPHLRHAVNTGGGREAWNRQVIAVLDHLDAISYPADGGSPSAIPLCRGIGPKSAVEKAIRVRKGHDPDPRQIPDLTILKDDQ